MKNVKLSPLPPWLDLDERKATRWPMRLSLIAESNLMGHVAIQLLDISTMGALLLTPSKLTVGSFLTVTMGYKMQYGGWIAWAKDSHAGLDFANPMPDAVVDHFISMSDPGNAWAADNPSGST